MSRFNETEAALLSRLRALKAKPEMAINLPNLGSHLSASGFTQNEIMEVLVALEQENIIAFPTGNRLLILKKLPP